MAWWRRARLWMVAAALLPVGVYFVPIWGIVLYAPQYPEGIFMYIWVHQITGQLDLVNGLNHYIGMQPIVPDSIPELRWMPWIVAIVSLSGLLVAWMRRWVAATVWTTGLALLGLVGLYDFYVWGYDYGHNLDPHAPIQVPGMSYQPPLIGVKELLNFTAISYPHVGAFLLGASFLCGLLASYFLWRESAASTSLSVVHVHRGGRSG